MLQTLSYKVNVAPDGVPPMVRLSQNENGRTLQFELCGKGEVTIPNGSQVTISGTKPDGVVYSATGSLSGVIATFSEDVQMTAVAGEWDAKLRIIYNGETIATIKIWFAIDSDSVEPGAVPSESELNGLVAEAQQYAESARSSAYGSPLTASTAADMTNTDKVYVYTGSESGYLYGHWYYYNGTAWTDGGVYQSQGVQTDPTLTLEGVPADAKATGGRIGAAEEDVADLKDALQKYDDLCRIIKVSDTGTTLGDIATILNSVNTAGDHVFFDMSALGVMMYLCTIYIDTANHVYKVFDLVSGRYAEGVYTDDMLLTMATAQANNLAVQSQIDNLQNEIDELGGKSVIKNWDTLGDLIAAGTSTDVISPGDTTELNWIASVLGTTTSGLTVNCTDMDKYIWGVGEAEEADYLFVYDGTAWTYNGEQIALSDFGLTVSGTPRSGEVMTIKTTVNPVSYTFVGYDDFTASDENVPHSWCLEQTYAPDTRVYNTYESLFCIQAGKSVPAGKWYLPMRSYRSGKNFNVCFELASAVGGSSKVQMCSTGYDYATYPDVNGTDTANVYKPKALAPILYGTTISAGATATIAILSDADVTVGGYTNIESLNTAANDPVVVIGDFDKSALGNNCWIVSNIREWLHDDTLGDSYVPPYDNNIASAYNRGRGFLWGLDPRVRALMQYADVYWMSGYGNHDIESYQRATGTAPSANAPTYYERSGEPGNRVYTALDPQPTAGADVSGYYVRVTTYTNGTVYISEDKVFLLSMKEMGFNIQTGEGNLTDLYGEYCGGELTNNAVADRAKYNKAGGTLNSYRWSRSGSSGYAFDSRIVSSTGGYYGRNAFNGLFVAPAIIIGKSA